MSHTSTSAPEGSVSIRRFLQRGASWSFLIKVGGTAMSFGTGIFLARVLGPADFGIYAYVMAVVTILSVPVALGLPQLLVREIAACREDGDWGLVRGLLRRANQAAALVATVLIGLAVIAGFWVVDSLPPMGAETFYLGLLLVPLLGFAALRVAALQGLHHVLLAQMPEGLLRPGLFLVTASLLWLVLGSQFNVVWAMSVQVGITLLGFIFGAWLLREYMPQKLRNVKPSFSTSRWAASVFPLLIINGVHIINVHTDILMLGLFTDSSDVGVYRVATRGAEGVLFVLVAANLTAAPVISRLYHQSEHKQLQEAITFTARMVLLFALPVALLLMFWGGPIIEFLFGSAYVGGALALAILAGGQLINAGAGSVSMLLTMTGRERSNAKIAVAGALTNITLNATLIPVWGINGAAAATATSIAVVNILLAISVRRSLGLDSTALGLQPLRA